MTKIFAAFLVGIEMEKDMNIIYEDDDLIVCHKQSGVPCESKSVTQKDVVSILAEHRTNNHEPSEIYLVHRLDQPVEGLMVVAKNQKAASILSKQITDHTFTKKYYAIISREQFPDEGVLEDYIVKDGRTNLTKVVNKNDPRAKLAKLSYRVIDSWDDKKLLDVTLYTGRHHQIRVQLASRTAPIIGDVKYGGVTTGHPLALCSHFLAFNHPTTGKDMAFETKPEGLDFSECKFF